jgi:hypothetical protein
MILIGNQNIQKYVVCAKHGELCPEDWFSYCEVGLYNSIAYLNRETFHLWQCYIRNNLTLTFNWMETYSIKNEYRYIAYMPFSAKGWNLLKKLTD